ncbi:MAG: Mut7-C RNAse domain-containing protein [Gemmatimonadota bacterium]
MTTVRFIADGMLGKLATWLRILGCDVEYLGDLPDDEIAERALRTGRVILTRDTLLVRRRKVRDNHFFVTGDGWRDQLRQVVGAFGIDPGARLFTRCVRCNEPLEPVDKPLVAGRVPPYVYETQEIFSACPSCRRLYWPATHRERMERQLREIFKERGRS